MCDRNRVHNCCNLSESTSRRKRNSIPPGGRYGLAARGLGLVLQVQSGWQMQWGKTPLTLPPWSGRNTSHLATGKSPGRTGQGSYRKQNSVTLKHFFISKVLAMGGGYTMWLHLRIQWHVWQLHQCCPVDKCPTGPADPKVEILILAKQKPERLS